MMSTGCNKTDNKCRCCLTTSQPLRSLQEIQSTSHTIPMLDMLGVFVGISNFQINKEINYICEACAAQLSSSYQFYTQCLNAQNHYIRLNPSSGVKPSAVLRKKPLRPLLPQPATEGATTATSTVTVAAKPLQRRPVVFRCRVCNAQFRHKDQLLAHRRLLHLTARPQWNCPACRLQFYSAESFRRHQHLHEDNICLFCNIGFPTEADVREHGRTQHDQTAPQFVCFQCNHHANNRRALLRHSRVKHGAPAVQFLCGICLGQSFTNRRQLREHLLSCCTPAANDELNPIVDAGASASCVEAVTADAALNFGALDDDMPVEFLNYNLLGGGEDLTDDDCCFDVNYLNGMVEEFLDDAFQLPAPVELEFGLTQQLLVGEGGNGAEPTIASSDRHSYPCPRCTEMISGYRPCFATQHELHLHLASMHNEPRLVCNQCGSGFTSMSALDEHRDAHKLENRLANESLAQLFHAKQLAGLDPDQANTAGVFQFDVRTSAAGAIVYGCQRCPRVYKTKTNALKHRCPNGGETTTQAQPTTVNPPPLLCCSLCDKTFGTLGGLKYHLLTHTVSASASTAAAQRAFACAYCSSRFLTAVNLAAHTRGRHSVVKPAQCEHCAQRFATVYQLRRHVAAAHDGRRTHVCSVCGKAYTQRSHLRHHEWTHSGVKRFRCGQCERAFTSAPMLRRHAERMHANIE